MLEKLRIVFTIPELRQKILLTLGLLAIYRVGWQVPLPIIDPKAMSAFAEETGGIGDLLRTVAVFSASQLSQATIFGLGIMPYISASIIFQLLSTVWPPLEPPVERGRGRPEEDQRIHPVCHCSHLSGAELGLRGVPLIGSCGRHLADPVELPGRRSAAIHLAVCCGHDHDSGHDLPDVAR